MNKEIEEMAQDIAYYCPDKVEDGCGDFLCYTCIATNLYNKGYHKTVWHKVADGDLPEPYIDIVVKHKDCRKYIVFMTDSHFWLNKYNGDNFTSDDIVAWTELPEYEV